MITLRPSDARGQTRTGWLDSRHTFSFNRYYDARHMGFRALRVINEDFVEGGQGFGQHPHQNMEILTYVVSGALEHSDSLGNGSVIRPGELQRMSAGTGIAHSEWNHSPEQQLHLLQIWILPEREGTKPSYEEQTLPEPEPSALRLMASPPGRDGIVTIHQDVDVYDAHLSPGSVVAHAIGPGRHAWLQLISGSVVLNGTTLAAGDGAAVSDENALDISVDGASNFLLFDLA